VTALQNCRARDFGLEHCNVHPSQIAQYTVKRRVPLQIPPLYLSSLAIISGDALGNLHVFIPWWTGLAATIVATALFLFRRPALGIAVAILGLAAAATLSVKHLIVPDLGAQSVHRFPDGAHVTLEGWVRRAPEPQGGSARTYSSMLRMLDFRRFRCCPQPALCASQLLGRWQFALGIS
jgi:hypothetical protein